jgi:hypothetical protein
LINIYHVFIALFWDPVANIFPSEKILLGPPIAKYFRREIFCIYGTIYRTRKNFPKIGPKVKITFSDEKLFHFWLKNVLAKILVKQIFGEKFLFNRSFMNEGVIWTHEVDRKFFKYLF